MLAAEHSGVLGPKVCLSPQLVVTPGRILGSRLAVRDLPPWCLPQPAHPFLLGTHCPILVALAVS